jgi:hypothetical protein
MRLDVHKNIRIPAEMAKEIIYIGAAEGLKFSDTIRTLITIGLKRKAAERFSRLTAPLKKASN